MIFITKFDYFTKVGKSKKKKKGKIKSGKKKKEKVKGSFVNPSF